MHFLGHGLEFSVACTFNHVLLRGGGAFCPGTLRSCQGLGIPRISLGAWKRWWFTAPDKPLVAIMNGSYDEYSKQA